MKKVFILLLVSLFVAQSAGAFVFQLEVKDKEGIKQLSTEQLKETYLDAIIEKKAGETFYGNSAFVPNEYRKYKNLLKYIVRLREEMSTREIEAPPYEEWLR